MSNFATDFIYIIMTHKIEISEACLAQLKATSRRSKGSIGFEPTSDGRMELTFREYQRNEGCRRNPQTLLQLPNGWLRKTARRYLLRLSVSDSLSETRVADEFERDSQEARQFLKHLSDVLNFI